MVRVVFFGMTGQFSLIPLEKLLAAKVEVAAVVVPARTTAAKVQPRPVEPRRAAGAELFVVEPYLERNIVHLAWAGQIPVWEVGSLSKATQLALLADLRPDLICIACFPYIFPPALLALPRYGCLNLHPSLLPAYRGPAPLFWIARQDEQKTGVTLHFLDQGIDTGDVVAQADVEREDGLSETELDRRCALAGAALLVEAIQFLERGQALRRIPQPETGATYFPWPAEADYLIPTNWPARRAFNFLRGAANWPLKVKVEESEFVIRTAISYSSQQRLSQPYCLLGDEIWIQFQPGVLRAKV